MVSFGAKSRDLTKVGNRNEAYARIADTAICVATLTVPHSCSDEITMFQCTRGHALKCSRSNYLVCLCATVHLSPARTTVSYLELYLFRKLV
jgi:hypothetical protein